MNLVKLFLFIAGGMFPLLGVAGEVTIVDARAEATGATWRFSVTLEHKDEGWEHYADAWRVIGQDDTEYGSLTLFHPHENEQPFTRSLEGVKIPPDTKVVYIEVHDKVHGWSPDKFKLLLK